MALSLFTGFQDPFFSDFERSLSRAFQPVFDMHREAQRADRGGQMVTAKFHPTDILEYKDKYSIVADTPGMTPEDITVELKGNTLVVSGEKSTQKEVSDDQAGVKVRRSERTFNKFTRSFVLPEDARTDGIAARVEHGVLTLDIPKEVREPARAEAKRIRVTGGTAPAQIGGGTTTPPQTTA